MATITVLMPVHNAEKFLNEAIDSILQQTFQDFEFIIIDDGSSDDSAAIVSRYSDSRISFYQNEQNLGISKTLNKGIRLAKTSLIARMDADDVSAPNRLQKQYDYMQAHPDCAMVSSLVRVITEEGEQVRIDDFDSKYLYYNLNFICWIYHPTVMYRKEAVMEVGMYSVPYAEDYELFWQLARLFKIHNLPEHLLDYRITSQSLHQVLKKKEYDQAQKDQLLRNLRHYAGEEYTLPDKYLQCFQHDFTALLEEQDVDSLHECIRELDHLNQHILSRENINGDAAAIKEAAYHKKEFIISTLARKLPRLKAIMFLLKIRRFQLLVKIGSSHVLRILK